ncbi:MAG TPA: ATPase, T2SS/T4P/T4SS family [Kofleriaceae bacterium]|nr:ATPase, T2SS/T4P/T4SS family [Kofleriaceae bacterium]
MIPKQVFEQSIMGHLAPILPFLEDPSVSEVMINGHDKVYIERGGRIHRTTSKFSSEEALTAALRNLAQYAGRTFGPERPILETRLPDGSRVEAILPPAAEGVHVAIRRFSRETLTMERLVGFGSLSQDAADTLAVLVAAKQNIVVAGGTGSGKTSFLNALSWFTDEEERIVVIEDNRELQLQRPHVVQLEAQPPDPRGRGQITIRDLFRATLRMRPDRIVVGEVRGGEALDLVQAMTSGHGGCLTTVHASHPRDAVGRLETLALMSDVELPLAALRAQIGSAIDIIVHTARASDGSRVVSHVSELAGYDPQRGYDIRDLFERRFEGKDASGRIISYLEPTGVLPSCAAYARAMGHEFPAAVLEAAGGRSAR